MSFRSWFIKTLLTRARMLDQKKRISKIELDPRMETAKPTNPMTITFDHELYVKIPIRKGFDDVDLSTKQMIANALVTPDNFRELFAPDLTEAEWNWLPDHSLEGIMKFRWIRNNLTYITLFNKETRPWAILHGAGINEDKNDFDPKKWYKMIDTVDYEDVRISFVQDYKDNSWLHTYISDIMKPGFNLERWTAEHNPKNIEEPEEPEEPMIKKVKTDTQE